MLWRGRPLNLRSACVTSVSARVYRERWDESKKKGMTGEAGGRRFPLLRSPPSPPSTFFFFSFFFFGSRSNFRAMTRLETLATQANSSSILLFLSFFLFSLLLLLFSSFFLRLLSVFVDCVIYTFIC